MSSSTSKFGAKGPLTQFFRLILPPVVDKAAFFAGDSDAKSQFETNSSSSSWYQE
jgi:hypothetical protein